MESEPKELPQAPGLFQRVLEIGLKKTLVEIERCAIDLALAKCDGNKSQAAKLLGWKRTHLINRMKEFHGMALLPPFRAKLNPPEIQYESKQNPHSLQEDRRDGEEVIPDALTSSCSYCGIGRGTQESCPTHAG